MAARRTGEALARAFGEFLFVPACLILGFMLLAATTYVVDREHASWAAPLRAWLQSYVFADAQATADLLGTIASGLITITSITVSLLLIALQQSASALTHQVYDQFLRNWRNQLYFGVFVGVSLFTLMTLASVGPLNPVIGGSVALLATIIALFLLLVLFYTTVDQMRPVVIIGAIHDHALAAREAQRALLRRTRRRPALAAVHRVPLAVAQSGFVTRIDLERIEAAVRAAGGEAEVVLQVSIGSYLVYGETAADVHAADGATAHAVAAALTGVIVCQRKRDLATDPLDAIDELETIGWTAISSAQSDADAGVLTIYHLRDILARWLCVPDERDATPAPVVYVDNVVPRLLAAFESLAVSASESMQHQSCAAILRTFAILFDRLGQEERRRAEDIVMRMLAALGDHVLTAELEASIDAVIATFRQAGSRDGAEALEAARRQLARTVGRLGSRSTRAQ
ncbi:MAG TPA: DUF2254 family protein [Casimicrobiaceae bacterium]|nr:DUF2254 family protein [Casimicrobiaceae bacterium]